MLKEFLSNVGNDGPRECKDALFRMVTDLVTLEDPIVNQKDLSYMVELYRLMGDVEKTDVFKNPY